MSRHRADLEDFDLDAEVEYAEALDILHRVNATIAKLRVEQKMRIEEFKGKKIRGRSRARLEGVIDGYGMVLMAIEDAMDGPEDDDEVPVS